MSCSRPSFPEQTPLERLTLSASEFTALPASTSAQEMLTRFEQLRELLWTVVELGNDVSAYTLSWNCINLYARTELLTAEQGDTGALPRLQELVRQSMALLP